MTTLKPQRNKELEALSVKASRVFVDAGLHGIEAEVVVVLDVSPRMTPLYADGSLQRLVAALLALAMKFDDDGVVPVWTFADEARHVGKMRRDDYVAWVDKNLPPPPLLTPGVKLPPSRYAPFIDAIAQRFFPREWATPPIVKQVGDRLKRTVHEYASLIEPRESPVFVIVVTSGDCDDPMETSKLLRRASHLPIFWQFAAVAPTDGAVPEFRFLRGIDKLTDTHMDSCGFFFADDFRDAERLFEGLLGEFRRYVEHPRVRQMVFAPPPSAATEDSSDRVVGEVLKLPPKEQARREQARVERELRRAAREKAAAEELARAAAVPRMSPGADQPEPAEPVHHDEASEPERASVAPPKPSTTAPAKRPQPPMRRETLPYQDSESAPGPAARVTKPAPTPQPAARATKPAAAPEPAPARRPQPPARHATRAFEAIPEPPAEPSVVLEGFDADDVEDTVETPAERLQRIRARREARKGSQ
ncbi:MAG: VWA domain-containing protein [Deltaproteobacteria bacterium]|nr:VWA domain-containing protein [Deltaproteobacteria bacterium]